MLRRFTLDYWMDDGWYVGNLKKVSSVFSQGESLEELEENIADAYRLVMEENKSEAPFSDQSKEIGVEV